MIEIKSKVETRWSFPSLSLLYLPCRESLGTRLSWQTQNVATCICRRFYYLFPVQSGEREDD